MNATPGMVALHTRAARALAVEVLLTEPEQLSEHALHSLYHEHEKHTHQEETNDPPMYDNLTTAKLREIHTAATLLLASISPGLGFETMADRLSALRAGITAELNRRGETDPASPER